jgi:hypothetical protein
MKYCYVYFVLARFLVQQVSVTCCKYWPSSYLFAYFKLGQECKIQSNRWEWNTSIRYPAVNAWKNWLIAGFWLQWLLEKHCLFFAVCFHKFFNERSTIDNNGSALNYYDLIFTNTPGPLLGHWKNKAKIIRTNSKSIFQISQYTNNSAFFRSQPRQILKTLQ